MATTLNYCSTAMFAYVRILRYVRDVKSYAKDDTGSCAAGRFRRSTKKI